MFSYDLFINTIDMKQTFSSFFLESERASRLGELLDKIDAAVESSMGTDKTDFEPEEVDFLARKVGELYDALIGAGERLPTDMQGAAGEKPRHLNTLNNLRTMAPAGIPESVMSQIDEMLNQLNEQGQPKTDSNPFEKPKWAKERDKKQADDQEKHVMAAFRKPQDDTQNKKSTKQIAKR